METVLQVFWYHNNAEVSQEPRYRVLHEGNFFCLDISPLSVSDEGTWKCVAENSSGQASSSSSFKVIGMMMHLQKLPKQVLMPL